MSCSGHHLAHACSRDIARVAHLRDRFVDPLRRDAEEQPPRRLRVEECIEFGTRAHDAVFVVVARV